MPSCRGSGIARGERLKTDPRCAACVVAEGEAASRAGGRASAGAAAEARALAEHGLALTDTPSVPLTRVHRLSWTAGAKPPFERARAVLHEAAIRLVQHVERELAGAANPPARFAIASRWAAAACHLDPRAAGIGADPGSAEELAEAVLRIANGPAAVDETAGAFELVRKSRNVLFLAGGVAELSLDRLLLGEILQHARRLYIAVDSAPLGGQATVDDVHRAGLAELATEILPAGIGGGQIGLVWEEASPELKGKLEVVDLVVAKGQANLYALHEREKEILKPMFCLLRTMCDPVAELFGTKGRATVMKVWK